MTPTSVHVVRGVFRVLSLGTVLVVALAAMVGSGGGGDPQPAPPPPPTALSVVSTSPANGAATVAVNAVIAATFSEALASSPNFTVTGPAGVVAGTVSRAGAVATFTPSAPLAQATAYTASVSGGTGVAGATAAASFSWGFTTVGSGGGGNPPPPPAALSVVSTSPANGAATVAVSAVMSATFSEALASSPNFIVTGPGGAVAGAVSRAGAVATFTPSAPLAQATAYTASVSGGTGVAGATAAASFSWSFTTVGSGGGGNPPPPPPPPPAVLSVVSTSPANGAATVAVNAVIAATFSEALASSPNFTVTGPAGVVAGAVSRAGAVATFTPSAPLALAAAYTASVSGGTGVAGATAAASFSWSFTTVGPPSVTLDVPAANATRLSGAARNIDTAVIKVVIYVLTNQWYVQPFDFAPYTDISSNGTWTSATHPWQRIVVLLVDPRSYTPAATKLTHPACDAGVLASAEYPPTAPPSIAFSGRTWCVKVAADPFDPGPNYWSNDPAVVHVGSDGLRLKIGQLDGRWQSAEVLLLESLGYGTYTVQVATDLSRLDTNTVAAPLFLYAAPGQEMDNEYGGPGGLVPAPNNAQFVVQPYTTAGNLVRYIQPAQSQFTTQMEWRADRISFRAWNGWSGAPAAADMIYQWTYAGANNFAPGAERVHINLWLLGGRAPASGSGDEMVIRSFAFAP